MVYLYGVYIYINIYILYIYTYKVFVKDGMWKRKKCRFYLFCFLDYQINYYEV